MRKIKLLEPICPECGVRYHSRTIDADEENPELRCLYCLSKDINWDDIIVEDKQ